MSNDDEEWGRKRNGTPYPKGTPRQKKPRKDGKQNQGVDLGNIGVDETQLLVYDNILNHLEEKEKEYYKNKIKQSLNEIEIGVTIFGNEQGGIIATNMGRDEEEVNIKGNLMASIKIFSDLISSFQYDDSYEDISLKEAIYEMRNEEWIIVFQDLGDYSSFYTIRNDDNIQDQKTKTNEGLLKVIDIINNIPEKK